MAEFNKSKQKRLFEKEQDYLLWADLALWLILFFYLLPFFIFISA